jgi:hypothetical protein
VPIDFHWKVPFILLINYSIMFIKFGNQIGVEMIMWLKIWFVYNPVKRKMKEIRHYHLEDTNCAGLEFFQEQNRNFFFFLKNHNKHGYVKALIEHTFIVWSYDTLKALIEHTFIVWSYDTLKALIEHTFIVWSYDTLKALIEHTFIVWSYDTLKVLTITPR